MTECLQADVWTVRALLKGPPAPQNRMRLLNCRLQLLECGDAWFGFIANKIAVEYFIDR